MADLTIQQVGTGSRINHPNWADVCNTTFAKGVISDFEVISTDPFTVSSNVKVTGAWGESEYIPLLYNQKPGYWDTAGGTEKAWMSFRCDDEVKVLLSEGVPKAVVGFYDGVPRVGEDIIKHRRPSANEGFVTVYYQCSKNSYYISPPPSGVNANDPTALGPNNENLDELLIEEPVYIYDGGEYYMPVGIPEGTPPYIQWKYREYFIITGPILYIFQTLVETWGPEYGDHAVNILSLRAALYSDDYLNSIKGQGVSAEQAFHDYYDIGPEWWPVYTNNFECQYLDGIFSQYPNSYYQTWWGEANGIVPDWMNYWMSVWNEDTTLRFYTYPHTKEELQAVGLWPV